jgi:peptide/nickel transport system permease protein
MGRTILMRVLLLPVILLGVSVVLFVAAQVIPHDPARLIVGHAMTPAVRKSIDHSLGLDQPLPVQYGRYLTRLVHGNLGQSIRYTTPVTTLLAQAFPATLTLVAAGALVTVLLTFPLGFLAAKYRGTPVDATIRVFSMIGTSTAPFIVGLGLILIFGFYLGWLPVSGRGEPPDLIHLILPAFVLGFGEAGHNVRIFRASLLDELQKDYVRAGRARGIGEGSLLLKHVGRNALGPTATTLGVGFARLGGAIILVETVFAWPGIGRLIDIGVLWDDFPLVSGALMLLLIYTIVVTFIVDLLYRMIDPRLPLVSA